MIFSAWWLQTRVVNGPTSLGQKPAQIRKYKPELGPNPKINLKPKSFPKNSKVNRVRIRPKKPGPTNNSALKKQQIQWTRILKNPQNHLITGNFKASADSFKHKRVTAMKIVRIIQ